MGVISAKDARLVCDELARCLDYYQDTLDSIRREVEIGSDPRSVEGDSLFSQEMAMAIRRVGCVLDRIASEGGHGTHGDWADANRFEPSAGGLK